MRFPILLLSALPFLLSAASPAFALSLLYTEQQIQDIDTALDKEAPQKNIAPEQMALVESIFVSNPTMWAVWINGKKVTPDHPETEAVRIAKVFDNSVLIEADISAFGAEQVRQRFTLKAGEALNLLTGEVLPYTRSGQYNN